MRYLCCRYCVAERVIGIFLSTSQRRISSRSILRPRSVAALQNPPGISPTWQSGGYLVPSGYLVSLAYLAKFIRTRARARARAHTHTHTHTHTRIPPPIYRRVRGFSLSEGWGSFDLLSGRAKSGISMKSAVGISTSNLSPSTYLCERICVQICIGCPVFSLPEFGSSWFFLQGNHRRDAPLPREFATPFNSSLWLCDWATPRVYFTFLLDEVRWAESDGLGYHNSV